MFLSSNLKCFIVLAKEKSLKKASEILFVTSSPISRRIKILEDELGFKLFSRTDHDFTLTKKGLELYEKIMPHYDKMTELEDYFSQKKTNVNIRRSLMIGVENLNPFLFSLLVKTRKKTESVSYCSCNTKTSVESLLSGEIHGVISHREINDNGVMAMDFFSEPACYLYAKKFPQYQLSDLKNTPIIIPTNGFYEDYVKNAHAKILTICPTAQVIIVDDIHDYLTLIASGEAVGLISESMVSFYQNKTDIFNELSCRVEAFFPELKTYIYYLKEREITLKYALEAIDNTQANA
ncbi:LysR family transcriptional regulator [Kalamiella sp. sgz302252]|uniref:LysR family transcriptional regulator n=1 Tax=Pantoea sp. sgz302252 TaxID=3341827 RepID=UPI0036D208DD